MFDPSLEESNYGKTFEDTFFESVAKAKEIIESQTVAQHLVPPPCASSDNINSLINPILQTNTIVSPGSTHKWNVKLPQI